MEIRRAVLADAKGIAKVQVDSWQTTYQGIVPAEFLAGMSYEDREQKWKNSIPEQAVFVAVEGEEVVGFSIGGPERTGNYPAYQGKGIGKALVKAVVEQLVMQNISSMTVCALAENPACRFYEKLGGKKIDTIEMELAGKKLAENVYGWENIQ